MSLALVHSRARAGVNAPAVRIEVLLSGGLPHTPIVGMPETAVRELRDRVRAAIVYSQFEFPQRRITINLAPADTPWAIDQANLVLIILEQPDQKRPFLALLE